MKAIRIILGAVLLLACECVQAGKLRVTDTRCEGRTNPLGVDVAAPSFSWKLLSSGRGVNQAAYQILVSDSESALKRGIGSLWDSGKRQSSASINVKYEGKPLESGKAYYWKVRVWATDGSHSSWSDTNKLQMGLWDEAAWGNAKWIALDTMPTNPSEVRDPRLPQLRKSFNLSGKSVTSAIMYISGLGHFELSVNGRKVGDHFLDPAWTNYDKTALYLTFDLSDMLNKTNNAIGVRLGNGFLYVPRNPERYRKLETSYSFPKMICKLRLTYADGTVEDIDSDNSWKVTESPVTFSSIYGGEDFDATADDKQWACPNYDDSAWGFAVETGNGARLKAQASPSLEVKQTFSPCNVFEAKPGVFIYDFGQNAAAIVDVRVSGPRGAKVIMRPAEYLTDDSLANQSNSGQNYLYSYRLCGEGEERWSPSFSYYGFRYIQMEGAVPSGYPNPDGLPVMEDIRMLHVSNASRPVGTFQCSDSLFNRIYSLIDWAVRSNLSHVMTDCPHREKLGWLEQTHLMSASIAYSYDVKQMFLKIIDDMRDCQQANGMVPNTAPEYAVFSDDFRDSPEWGSAAVLLPWFVYRWYGDTSVLEKNYDLMKAYVDYLTSRATDHIVSHGLGDWYDLGPNHPGYSQLTSRGLTSTAMYYHDLTVLSQVAHLLGKETDGSHYAHLAEEVKTAFNHTFFNAEKGYYDSGSQTANALPLCFDMSDEKDREVCLRRIVDDIRSRGNAVSSGDIGYGYLLRALMHEGASSVIYDMNSCTDKPGYGYQLARGATALTESWSALKTASHNHCMLGHLTEWLYGALAGIRPHRDSVAFKEFLVCPEPVGSIRHAKAEFDSPYGRIANAWEIKGNTFVDKVCVPPNTTARLFLPTNNAAAVSEGGKPLVRNKYVRLVGEEEGRTIVEVGSGTYEFSVKN